MQNIEVIVVSVRFVYAKISCRFINIVTAI